MGLGGMTRRVMGGVVLYGPDSNLEGKLNWSWQLLMLVVDG